jgi:diguanylate cyclase (GGDEF)-like protein
MTSAPRTSQPRNEHETLPLEIYFPLIASLYKDGRTLLVGTIIVTGSIGITFWKTGDRFLLYCAMAFILVAGARGLLIRAYNRLSPTIKSIEAAKQWEFRYVTGASVSVGLLGIWCYIAFSRNSDPFATVVSFSMTIAYLTGIFARNFGNIRFVIVQALCGLGPMIAALLLWGNAFDWAFAAFLAPLFIAIKSIAERLRTTLLDAVFASRDMALLAKRFDTALNNMPHGLCMFDSKCRIVVANQQLNRQIGLPPDFELKGASLRKVVECGVNAGLISKTNAQILTDSLHARLSGGGGTAFVIEMLNCRTFEFTVQAMEDRGMVVLIEDITERKIAEAKINHLAQFDPLTGLPNRMTLRERMEQVLDDWRPDNICAIHFIDLDRFKQVNDTLGHTRGDLLLQAVAARLREAAPDAHAIARFGGDEFVILQASIKSLGQAEALATRVLSALAGAYDLRGHEVVVSGSIGLAAAESRIDADQLLQNADMALYQAKSEGPGTWCWFEEKMEINAQARRNLEIDLRNALVSGSLELYYQPIFNLKTRRIATCEALLRWPHHRRGMISPAEFIPLAEETGMIVEIGKQALYKACEECRHWPGNTAVAVNFSAIQFERNNVPALVRETLDAAQLPASRLEIEITESTLLRDTSRTLADLRRLQELGVTISVDDFGTAYSSLNYLHSLPLHKVKIDQSFVQCLGKGLGKNERRITLLRGMARLSAQLGLRVVVEGVETEEQLELLIPEDSIDEVQGYLFCRPLPAADVRNLLQATHVNYKQVSGPKRSQKGVA